MPQRKARPKLGKHTTEAAAARPLAPRKIPRKRRGGHEPQTRTDEPSRSVCAKRDTRTGRESERQPEPSTRRCAIACGETVGVLTTRQTPSRRDGTGEVVATGPWDCMPAREDAGTAAPPDGAGEDPTRIRRGPEDKVEANSG